MNRVGRTVRCRLCALLRSGDGPRPGFARPVHPTGKPPDGQRSPLPSSTARRGDWKYLKINDNEYLFNITADSRERANKARVYPELLDTYRAAYDAWAETVPPIPDIATYSLVSSIEDFPFAER